MVYSIENAKFRVNVNDLGAELTNWIDKADDYEYIWQDRTVWNGQSPILFPIVGRLRDDIYEIEGKEYTLPKHGFARRMVFALEEQKDDEMTFLLKDTEETLEKYPFPFELRIRYELTENGLIMENRVTNTGDKTMYFSLGTHPAFACEMGDKIVMDAEETALSYIANADSLRCDVKIPVWENGKEITITPNVYDQDALFFDCLNSNGCTLVRANGRNVHVDFGGAPSLGFWAKPGAKYTCIEPWYGIPDRCDDGHDFTKKEQIIALEPGEEFLFPLTMSI